MGIQSINALQRIVAYPEDVVSVALAESRSVASDIANLEQRLLCQMELGKNGFQIVGGGHASAPAHTGTTANAWSDTRPSGE